MTRDEDKDMAIRRKTLGGKISRTLRKKANKQKIKFYKFMVVPILLNGLGFGVPGQEELEIL